MTGSLHSVLLLNNIWQSILTIKLSLLSNASCTQEGLTGPYMELCKKSKNVLLVGLRTRLIIKEMGLYTAPGSAVQGAKVGQSALPSTPMPLAKNFQIFFGRDIILSYFCTEETLSTRLC